eukprot:7722501-Alexandrium_andersonii.AAC.1
MFSPRPHSQTPITLLPDAILAIAPVLPGCCRPSKGHVGTPRIEMMDPSQRACLRSGGNPTQSLRLRCRKGGRGDYATN